jgi:hypothetical protein
MTTPETIERAVARLTAEAKLWACLDQIEARLQNAGLERDARAGSRAGEPRLEPPLEPGTDSFELREGRGRD